MTKKTAIKVTVKKGKMGKLEKANAQDKAKTKGKGKGKGKSKKY